MFTTQGLKYAEIWVFAVGCFGWKCIYLKLNVDAILSESLSLSYMYSALQRGHSRHKYTLLFLEFIQCWIHGAWAGVSEEFPPTLHG